MNSTGQNNKGTDRKIIIINFTSKAPRHPHSGVQWYEETAGKITIYWATHVALYTRIQTENVHPKKGNNLS